MKDNDSMSEEEYFKDVEIGAFIFGWIPFSIVIFLIVFLVLTIVGIIFRTLFYADFSIIWYLVNESPFAHPGLPSLVAFVLCLYSLREGYRLIKKKFFATVNDEKLMLRFGKDSFLWDDIQKVDLEGDRKLIITFLDIRTVKRKRFDLKWLQEKEDFIYSLKNNCTARNIPFCESEISFLSRIGLLINLLNQYPFV